MGMKGLHGFFDTWGGVTPLLAPDGVLTMLGHSRYPLLIVEILTHEKVNRSRERLYLFMHSFTKPWYRMYVGT